MRLRLLLPLKGHKAESSVVQAESKRFREVIMVLGVELVSLQCP